MSSYAESELVAGDFRVALEDVTSNSRYEIHNLTVIARENTEHALGISGTLMDHIKRVGHCSHLAIIDREKLRCQSHNLGKQRYKIKVLTNESSPDRASEEASCFIRSRLHRQEYRHPIHSLLWTQALPDIHGCLCLGGQCHAEENGRDA